MKNIKSFFILAMILIIFIGIGLHPLTVSAWGDSDGGRPSYSLQQMGEDALGDQIIFNSIEIIDTDYEWHKNYFGTEIPKTTITHEKNFVGAREDNGINDAQTNIWDGSQIYAEDGKTYVLRIYAHNDNPNGEETTAENTRVGFFGVDSAARFDLIDLVDENGYQTGEQAEKYQVEVSGKITSSNATPSRYWDEITFYSDVPFHLEYVYGSALLENGGFASRNVDDENRNIPGAGNGPIQLSDDIVNKASEGGVLIGYNSLDGRVPGGYQYAEYVTIRVKVVYDGYNFLTENKVRMNDTKEWSKTVEAKVGDKVDFQIQYKNTSNQRQADVIVKDTLPSNLRYVPGTIKIKNGSHPKGDTVDGDALVTGGLKVGSYGKNSNVYLMFTTEVVDEDLAEGTNTLVNWAQAMVGDTVGQDSARVVVQNNAGFYRILIGYGIAIAICLIFILIFIFRITKQSRAIKRRQK